MPPLIGPPEVSRATTLSRCHGPLGFLRVESPLKLRPLLLALFFLLLVFPFFLFSVFFHFFSLVFFCFSFFFLFFFSFLFSFQQTREEAGKRRVPPTNKGGGGQPKRNGRPSNQKGEGRPPNQEGSAPQPTRGRGATNQQGRGDDPTKGDPSTRGANQEWVEREPKKKKCFSLSFFSCCRGLKM